MPCKLQAADVVLYDALVSDEILALCAKMPIKSAWASAPVRIMCSRKKTNRLLLHYAQQGKRVVRLKGGDPFVFGRGGEEAQALAAAEVPFRIVPGITAVLGATAYAGIPLTHRDYAQTALFITGHCRPDGDGLQWQTAGARQTNAGDLYGHGEGRRNRGAIDGTRPRRRHAGGGGVQRHAGQTKRANRPPRRFGRHGRARRARAMIIGEVVALRDELRWFSEGLIETAVKAA